MNDIILFEVARLHCPVPATAQLWSKACNLSCNWSASDEP